MSLVEINQRLDDLARQREEMQRKERLLGMTQQQLAEASARRAEARQVMEKEGQDVKALEGMSLGNLFATIMGNRDEKLEKERLEFVRAELRYEEACHAVSRLEEDVRDLERAVRQLPAINVDYQMLLEQKQSLLAEAGTAESVELAALSARLAELKTEQREVREAVAAGRAVLSHLAEVEKSLGSAAGWGVWDMLGGGLIAGIAKHSHVDEARNKAHQAQQAFRSFVRELKDVRMHLELNIDIDSFTRFADFFFDGLIMDWVVQSKINNALDSVRQQRKQVEMVMGRLQSRQRSVEHDLQAAAREREEALGRA